MAGLLLTYLVYRPTFRTGSRTDKIEGIAPALSAQPFHQSFVSEEVCLKCHAQKRELPAFGLVAPKIPHEVRRQCVGCHLLPSSV